MKLTKPQTRSYGGVRPDKALNVARMFEALGVKNPNVLALALSVSDLETGLGTSYHNYGSVYDPKDKPPCNPPNVQVSDTGFKGEPFTGCLEGYSSADRGASKFLKTMLKGNVVKAAKGGDFLKAVKAMRANKYFSAKVKVYWKAVKLRLPYYLAMVGEEAPSAKTDNGPYIGLGLSAAAILGVLAYSSSQAKEEKTDDA